MKSLPDTPKVSIITMTYNDCAHLEKCVTQILKQDYENIEYIIVDGGSSDGTHEIIQKAAQQLGDKLKWVSESDEGLYDALNKGIRMATGAIVGLMCDEFADAHVLSDMVRQMQRDGTDGVHGDIDYMADGKVIRKWRMGAGTAKKLRWGWMPGHPTLYVKREVYETYGFYKTDYKIAADYEFMIRILKEDKVRLSYIPRVLVHMFHGEESASTGGLKSYLASFGEGMRALRENHMPHPFITTLRRTCMVLRQFVR